MTESDLHNNPYAYFVAAEAAPIVFDVSSRAESQLRQQFTTLRQAADLTHEDVGGHLDWSASKVYRIETGLGTIKVADALAMMSLYGVTDKGACGAIRDKVLQTKKSQQSSPYRGLLSPAFRQFVECEADAERVQIFESDFLPDIVQPAAYANVLATVYQPDQEPADLAILENLRTRRAAYLLGKYGPPLEIILDESILYKVVGAEVTSPEGRHQAISVVMNGLKRLNTAGRPASETSTDEQLNPAISVQIIPYTHGFYPSIGRSHAIVSFAAKTEPPVVYTRGHHDEQFTQDTKKVAADQKAFQELSSTIPSASDTNEILDWILASNANRHNSLPQKVRNVIALTQTVQTS